MSYAAISLFTAVALASVGAPAPDTAAPTAVTPAAAPAPDPSPLPSTTSPPTTLQPAPAEPAPPTAEPVASPPSSAEPAPTEPTVTPGIAGPQPLPAAPPPTTIAVQPTPTPMDAGTPRRNGRALLTAGGIMMGVGGASLLFVALPARAVRNAALNRADREDALAFTSRETRYDRARRADNTMEAGFWIGAPLVVTGLAMVITGVVLRNNARRARVAAAPSGIIVRF